MECKKSEQCISGFINRTLYGDELRQFIIHIKSCPDCSEELGIEYLINEALPRIENGESVDLDKELNERILYTSKAQSLHWIFANTFRSIEVLASITMCLSVLRIFILYILPRFT